jgi:hypothetical protein
MPPQKPKIQFPKLRDRFPNAFFSFENEYDDEAAKE